MDYMLTAALAVTAVVGLALGLRRRPYMMCNCGHVSVHHEHYTRSTHCSVHGCHCNAFRHVCTAEGWVR